MPHQWFFWKTFLDLGQGELAWQVARTALEVWRREVQTTYNCWEHFVVATGRGAGWHLIGGLSAPVLNWYSAYHRPGRLTTGFDVWVDAVRVEVDCRALEAELRVYGRAGRTLSVLASLDLGVEYAATWNGEPCATQTVHSGVFYVDLPCGERGTLRLRPA